MSERIGSKNGIATKDELQILWKLVSGELGVPVIFKPLVNLIAPGIIDGIDNKVAERIPEKWQIICENLVTKVVVIVEDGTITEEEAQELGAYTATVVDTQIDVPLLEDDVEAVMFIELFRFLAALLYSYVNKKRAEKNN